VYREGTEKSEATSRKTPLKGLQICEQFQHRLDVSDPITAQSSIRHGQGCVTPLMVTA
jgi:hypothetical protein